MRKRVFALVALAGLALLVVSTVAAATVVRPGAPDGWAFSATGTASVAVENGIAPSGFGVGSITLKVGADGDSAAQARSTASNGTRLDQLTALSYSTYVTQDGSGGQAPYLILNVDDDDDGVTDDLLFFEPVYQGATYFPSHAQGPLTTGTWQSWDALQGGWWSLNGTAGMTPGTGVKPLSAYTTAEPNAELSDATSGSLRVVAGFGAGAWDGFVGSVDGVTVGVSSGEPTTYDFEADQRLGDCVVTDDGSTITLLADCTTDETLFVPDGYTFDGDGHTITAVDPAGGAFLGAVLTNAGDADEVHVTDVTIQGSSTAVNCGPFVGVQLTGAGGSLTNSSVLDIRRDNVNARGCQTGLGVRVDSAGDPVDVEISNVVVTGYQKNGVTVNGEGVAATITGSTIMGDGPVAYIAQNGIQVSRGATALIEGNVVSDNDYTPADTVACGLLFFDADGVKQKKNDLFANEIDLCNAGRGGGHFNAE